MTTISVHASEPKGVRIANRVMLAFVWFVAAFWAWFVIASHWNEGPALAAEGLTVVIPIAFAAWLVWKRPLWGGLVLIALGTISAWTFANAAVWILMSAPLVLAGAFFTWLGARRSS